ETWATTVRALGGHGGLRKYHHDLIGVNSRLDGLQAVVLRAKLTRLPAWDERRRAAPPRDDELLAALAVVPPVTAEGKQHVWRPHVIGVPGHDGDGIVARLNEAGVGVAIHSPTPVHLTPAYARTGTLPGIGALPHAERAAAEILSLPLYPQLTPDQQ